MSLRLLTVFFTCVVYFANLDAQTASIDYELKAAYIARFTEFIEWPNPASTGNNKVFTICVFGNHPILTPLTELRRLMNVANRSIEVYSISRPEEAARCEIVFVPFSENQRIKEIHQHTANKPVLIINEVPATPTQGQLISLYKEGDRLRIQIHLHAAQEAGFSISSRLLKLASVVE
jgi:hypothetical protein